MHSFNCRMDSMVPLNQPNADRTISGIILDWTTHPSLSRTQHISYEKRSFYPSPTPPSHSFHPSSSFFLWQNCPSEKIISSSGRHGSYITLKKMHNHRKTRVEGVSTPRSPSSFPFTNLACCPFPFSLAANSPLYSLLVSVL